VKTPKDLYSLRIGQVSYKERTKDPVLPKKLTSTVGLPRVPNKAHEALLLTNGRFHLTLIPSPHPLSPLPNFFIIQGEKMNANIVSKVNFSKNYQLPLFCIDKCTTVVLIYMYILC
jgi:hypothetical protein